MREALVTEAKESERTL